MGDLTTVILAAGAGTRMKSEKAKVAHEAAGRSLLGWVMAAAEDAGSVRSIVVVGHQAEEVAALVPPGSECVFQAQRLGTGHAVRMAAERFTPETDSVLVLCGDTPLLRGDTLKSAWENHRDSGCSATVLTAMPGDPTGYGRILRNAEGHVAGIVEHKDATPEQREIREINTGVFLFKASALLEALPLLENKNSQGEYYLTDTLAILIGLGGLVGSHLVADPQETIGVNDRTQLAEADSVLQKRIRERHMKSGVSFRLPETSWIAHDVEIGPDTLILPGCMLEKGTVVGPGCIIGPHTRIAGSVISGGVTIANSVVTESEIGEETKVGPFAYLRPGSRIGRHVKIGDFVEIKKSVIGDDTKISHLTYVGDAEVGQRVNLGCGVVVVNYDGHVKNRTVIGNDAFVGCNTNLVSPVEVKEHAYIAAGSTITQEVPAYALGIARSRQTVLEDWVRRKGFDKSGGK